MPLSPLDNYYINTYGPTGLNILSHFWPLNESSGNAIDAIAGLNGTPSAQITQGTANILPTSDGETSYTEAGTTSNGVTISSNFGAYPKSYECWIKPTTISAAISNGLWQDGGNSDGIYIAILTVLGWFGMFANGGGANNYVVFTPTVNTIYHVVFTATSTTVKAYINGVSQTVVTTGSPPAPTSASSNIMAAPTVNGLDGLGQKFLVYNSVLSQAQVTANYNAGFSGPPVICTGISSSPATFNTSNNVTFGIPSGVYTAQTWCITSNMTGATAGYTCTIRTGGAAHHDVTQSGSGNGAFNFILSLTANQIADLNAAAGGTLPVTVIFTGNAGATQAVSDFTIDIGVPPMGTFVAINSNLVGNVQQLAGGCNG